MSKRIAVVLCGSGYKDGSEIRESVATLWSLSQEDVTAQCFAPNENQAEVVNCLTDKVEGGQNRNMLVESARIARGEILPLTQLKPSDFDAIILPGGTGVAKNLCDFATKGAEGTVHMELQKILDTFLADRKPIGAICISPMLIALAFKGKQLELTVGAKSDASDAIEKLGHKHVAVAANGCHTDTSHRIVTTPAYMYGDAPLHKVFMGIQKLVKQVLTLTQTEQV